MTGNQVTAQQDRSSVAVLRSQLSSMSEEIRNALPSHIHPEKFQRVVLTVVQQNADLLAADRKTLLASCMKCAADGLVPDGREAALVIFNTKVKRGGRDEWVKGVQYMPMIGGLLKRARNSGEIAGIIVNVVHERDSFVQRPDDFDHPLEHRPPPLGEDRGKPIGAYALVKLKDGTLMHDVMNVDEINRVRAVSRSKDSGPWVQWWDQMARKTIFRRLSKWLPMDAETDEFLHRDDEREREPAPVLTVDADQQPQQPASKLDALEAAGEVVEITAEAEAASDPDTDFAADLVGQMRAAKTLAALKAVSTKDVRAKVAEIGKRNPDLYAQIVQAGEDRAREIEHPAPAADDGWPGDNVEMEV